MLKLSNNTLLPEAPVYGVKSFWLLLVTVLITACNAMGFDLAASLCDVGLGCSAEDIGSKAEHAVSLVQQLLPIITAVWLWFERRAPNFRLVFWRKSPSDDGRRAVISAGSSALMVGLFLLLALSPTMAATCAEATKVDATLRQKFGEAVVGRGLADQAQPTLLYANPDTGSWTLVVLVNSQACAVVSGTGWQAIEAVTGEPT